MTVLSKLLGRFGPLGPPETTDVAVERDLPMRTPDGLTLLADRWYAQDHPTGRPVILMRSPYGRHQFGLVARLMVERGYQVVVQSCRESFGSGGEWLPFRNEAADGRATYAWLAQQPWAGAAVMGFGPSYLGLTQWAVATDPPPGLAAIVPMVTARRFRDIVIYPGGSFTLETGATWLYLLQHQELGWAEIFRAQLRAGRLLSPAFTTLPLSKAEQAVLGREVAFYQDWLRHDRLGDSWWDPMDFTTDASRVPPASFVGGWYDIFLPAQVDDYVAVRDAGRTARLTIGPWIDSSLRGGLVGLADGIEWFDQQVRRRPPKRTSAVRLWVIGRHKWVDLDTWPPPAVTERWYLHPGGRLRPEVVAEPASGGAPPDRFLSYDPADPTPSVGGPTLNVAKAGPRDQARREQRSDVLTYTSDPLQQPMTVAGPLSAELWVRPSVEFVDVHVRLCTVDDRGRSRNLSDGILRLQQEHPSGPDASPAITHGGGPGWGAVERTGDGLLRVRVRMWPTAVTWQRGQRIRLQVAAGAHPLFARNLGAGEPLGSATRLVAVDQEVYRDADHPSAVELPVSSI